eukprot:jgi/Chrzof1/3187/Cz12g15050.t1
MFTNWYCFGLLPFTASERNYCVSGHQLTRLIAVTVSSSAAGVAAGIIYAPILAARALCGKFARPAMLVGGAWCAVRGAWRLLKLRGMGPVALLRALASEDTREKLEALAKIAARAARSTSFRKAFISFDGITELLKLLPKGMDGSLLEAAIKALCSLLKDADGRDAFITAGGVPFLVHLLDHPSAEVVSSAMSMLATMAGNSMAQEAIRDADGVPLVVAMLLSPGASPTTQSQAMDLMSALSADPPSQAAMVQAGGMAALLHILEQPLPRTQVKETAVTTLHVLVRGIPDHLSHLCAQPRAQPCLQAALNAYGPSWYPCKADMHCLLNLMSKHVLQATAPDAVMVEMPEME